VYFDSSLISINFQIKRLSANFTFFCKNKSRIRHVTLQKIRGMSTYAALPTLQKKFDLTILAVIPGFLRESDVRLLELQYEFMVYRGMFP